MNASVLAWRRFSRGLPEEVNSVEQALETGLRSFEQWRTCLESANHFAWRVNSHVHRRAAGSSPENVFWRSLRLLSTGEALTAETMSRTLEVHVDVVRRAAKIFRKRGWVTASSTYTKFQAREFSITALGLEALERDAGAEFLEA
jgi:hypothetical protein